MQYTHRRLHLSVTEMRRYSTRRPKPSRMPSVSRCTRSSSRRAAAAAWSSSLMSCAHFRNVPRQPRAVAFDVCFALPDRQPLLDFFDDVARNVVRLGAVSSRRRDRDAHFADLQCADAMDRGQRCVRTKFGRFAQNLTQYAGCHLAIGVVFNPGDAPAFVDLTYDSEE